MSKVANMLNMVKILEDGKIHTIQDLADELEVSTRMIRIYKQELEQAGIYIQGKQGINGGYILDNMKSTIDIGLTGEEIYQLKNMKKNELDEAIINKIIKAYITNEHRKDNTESKQLMPEFTEIYKDVRDEYLQPVHKRVIYNYINPQNVIEGAEEKIEDSLNDKTTTFLTVARLTKQKAIDRIIRVHKKLIDNNFMHEFYVIGDGPERENLEKLIQELNVQNTFHLLGKKENPYPYMKQAQFFCLLSEFEGYGMVIEEAKILNKPIIITDTAAREAVQNYENSIIVNNNEEGIYAEIKEVLQKKIKSFSNKQEKYDNSKIITKLEKLLEEEVKTINI